MRTLLLSASLLLPLSPSLLPAQEARSRPVGYLSQTIPAGQTRSFSVPFDSDVSSLASSVGKLTAIGTDYFECSTATWTAGAFSTDAAPYFIRITSGTHAGRTFRVATGSGKANTATRLYVIDDGLGLASLNLATGANGTRFEIVPGDTLGTFFGTTTPIDTLVLQGAADPLQADLVQIWGGAAWLNFYYNTTWQRWARDTDLLSDPSRNNFLLRSDRGLMITRRGATPLDLLVAGRVLNTPQRAFHTRADNALTFLATMQAADVTLGTLALQSIEAVPKLTPIPTRAFSPPPHTLLLSSFNGDSASGGVIPPSTWVGNVTQNSGYITIGGTARDDNGWRATGLSLDVSGMSYLTITAQRDPGNAAGSLFLQFEDINVRTRVFSLSTSSFAVGTPTQAQIFLGVWSGDFDFTQIVSWSIGGGGVGTNDFRLSLHQVEFGASAIPEPSTYAAMMGLVALAAAAYRHRTAVAR